MSKLQAGAATVAVQLKEDCFPNSEFVGKHDDVYVRCIIIRANVSFAILSADMPSMHPSDIRYCKEVLKTKAAVDPEMSWITVNHSFSAPHLFRADFEQGMKNTMLPPVFQDHPEMLKTAERINDAYYDAIDQAVEQAAASVREAFIGFAEGTCNVNVNRNMFTANGWWQGVDQEGFADHALPVIRLEDVQGKVIAVIYNYSCQSSVTQGAIFPDGGKLMSSDLPGTASAYIEREFEGATAVFLPGATDDQVPLYKINYTETDKDGNLQEGSCGEAGYVLLEQQGRLLGNTVVNLAASIHCSDQETAIYSESGSCICNCQKREVDMSNLKPSLQYTFIPDGQCELPISFIRIGKIALLGLVPEMDGINISSLREKSPYQNMMAATFINGNEKSMPQKSAYGKFQYGAMNSPFAEGSAEHYCEEALQIVWNEYEAHNRILFREEKIL